MVSIGPAGAGGLGYPEAVRRAARLKFDCMEVTFTYGVRMRLSEAAAVGKLAGDKGLRLSVHAPYYLNLASEEAQKLDASMQRIMDACERAHLLGARNVVFHAGFYQKRTAADTFRRIRTAVVELQDRLRGKKWPVNLCPEITGKPSQFGSLEECLRLRAETGCGLCVDFAHLYARQQGAVDWGAALAKLPGEFHAHVSGIQFGPKGERCHTRLTSAFFTPLARALVKRRADVTLICESPAPYRDAALMQRLLASTTAGR
jgi:deoxyribonuclease-4